MSRAAWHCHDCEHVAPSIGKAREHSKIGPVYRNGKWMRHVLTQDADAAQADRERTADDRTYGAS